MMLKREDPRLTDSSDLRGRREALAVDIGRLKQQEKGYERVLDVTEPYPGHIERPSFLEAALMLLY